MFATRRLKLTSEELGRAGERIVALSLRRRSMRILGSRVATPFGEIDLVALDGETLVCIEVKSGRTRIPLDEFGNQTSPKARASWRPGHRFRLEDYGRVQRASHWLARRFGQGGEPRPARVDLCELLIEGPPPSTLGLFYHPDLKDPLPSPRHH